MQLPLTFHPPASRLSDPTPSHLAERAFTRSGARGAQAEAVYRLVAEHLGATAGELAAASGGRLDSVQVTRRLNDLAKAGRIAKGPPRVCRAHGRLMTTWQITGDLAR